MANTAQLFDLSPYTRRNASRTGEQRPRRSAMPPEVWEALCSLKETLDSRPALEKDRRRREYEALERRRS